VVSFFSSQIIHIDTYFSPESRIYVKKKQDRLSI